jgi:hypothetical protein
LKLISPNGLKKKIDPWLNNPPNGPEKVDKVDAPQRKISP